MNRLEARKYLSVGYWLFCIGIFIGIVAFHDSGPNVYRGVFLIGYVFWATYHGVCLVKKHLLSFFDFKGVHVKANSIPDLFAKNAKIKYYQWIIIVFAGYLVGCMGGAVFQQIRYSLIAYR